MICNGQYPHPCIDIEQPVMRHRKVCVCHSHNHDIYRTLSYDSFQFFQALSFTDKDHVRLIEQRQVENVA